MKSTTFETDTSDFHKITSNVLRKTISKGNAQNIFYRDYKALMRTLLRRDFSQN